MSKFCMYCGSEMDDNASICPSCNSAQTSAEETTASAAPGGLSEGGVLETVKGLPKNIKIILIAGAAVAVIIIVLIIKLIFFSSSHTKPIDNYFKALETGKGKYFYECYPEFILENQMRTGKKDKILDKLNDTAESAYDNYEDKFGEDFDISYTVKDEEELDDSDLKKVEKKIKNQYNERVDISKGYEVKIKAKIKGDDDHKTTTQTFEIYKIEGDWCLIDTSLIGVYDGSSYYDDYDDDDYDY